LDHAKHIVQQDAGVLSKLLSAAGEGIEMTSVLLTWYNAVSKYLHTMLFMLGLAETNGNDDQEPVSFLDRTVVSLSPKSPLWSWLTSNSTLHVHYVVLRRGHALQKEAVTLEEATRALH
jgi:hypothetical protein